MISHPFEIKPSASNAHPDVLMVTWRGATAQSSAEMFLPAVSSKAILALADKLYGVHRITASDAHTIQFPAGDLTLVPVPSGGARYAGLLTVTLQPSLPLGRTCVVSVRQLASASARIPPPPPPPPPIQIETPEVKVTKLGARESTDFDVFYWHAVQGAFQYTITSEPAATLLLEQERLLGWLKWKIEIAPAKSHWLPVMERYLKYTGQLVWNLGTDPNTIPPSQTGTLPGKGTGKGGGTGPGKGHGGEGGPPICHDEEHECTGKVVAIDYDRFGDFRGFLILTEEGHHHAFFATEHAIEALVREAWEDRTVVSVYAHEHDPHRPNRVVLRRYH